MLTEYHCHELPGIDDGADKVETSLAMLDIMKEQGVEKVIFTPHFYCHRERSVERFLEKRQEAFEAIKDKSPIKNMLLGAEVAIENGLSEVKDIEKLAVQGTKLILLELPYRDYADWMSEEIYNISAEYSLKIILAHVHRYLEYYSKEQLEKILSSECIMQVNNEAFTSWSEKKMVKNIIKEGRTIVFGSDAHNMGTRCPNWDMLLEECSAELLDSSNELLEIRV